MSHQFKIHITGDRQSGKTSAAVAIAKSKKNVLWLCRDQYDAREKEKRLAPLGVGRFVSASMMLGLDGLPVSSYDLIIVDDIFRFSHEATSNVSHFLQRIDPFALVIMIG